MKITRALIGHTGFVGSNLAEQSEFSHLFNSKNISEIQNMEFDEVVCAGVSATKWLANKNPGQDYKNISELFSKLRTVKTKQFTLISTVDVFPSSDGKVYTERNEPFRDNHHAYGVHRAYLERAVMGHFPKSNIIRLPALFGENLKKNVLYDLINQNCLDAINPASSFQWLDVGNLNNLINMALENNIRVAHLVSPPIKTQEIIDARFKDLDIGREKSPEAHYNVQTEYAHLFGSQSLDYTFTRESTLARILKFIDHQISKEKQ